MIIITVARVEDHRKVGRFGKSRDNETVKIHAGLYFARIRLQY